MACYFFDLHIFKTFSNQGFFILLGKHVVFGKVIKGYNDVIKSLVEVAVDGKDRPTVPIVISNCGELELSKFRTMERVSSI